VSVGFQGQSDYTRWKIRGLVAAAVGISARIHAAKFGRKYPFWLFDLYAGSGYNEEADCLGSPIAMYEEAQRLGVAPILHAVEVDAQRIAALSARPQIRERLARDVWLHHGSNSGFWALALELVRAKERPQYAHGLALFDPNNSDIDQALLAGFSRALPCVDIVINYSGSSVKRASAVGAQRESLNALLDAAEKKHWLIRRPMGPQQWSLIVGRNVQTGDYRAMGFEHLDSAAGRDIVQTLVLTRKQIDASSGQAPLSF
jgi:hypothetical protein